MTWSILSGDCLERLADLDDDSIEAVVTDPPYGLSAEPDAAEVLRHWLDGDDYQHRGGGFMGKTWDSFVPGPTVWRECLRVLKPGGHLVAFFGTRTVDLGGMAIRLAGFEIRDCLAWHYGSGFPKSLDVSKAIDKAAGAEREVVGTKKLGGNAAQTTQEKGGTYAAATNSVGVAAIDVPVTAPATDLARQWQGWGTALKPAFEPIILARKPLIGTVAENVTRFGTGALNVDGCRVGLADGEKPYKYPNGNGGNKGPVAFIPHNEYNEKPLVGNPSGRWPANLVLDDQAAAMLDEQSGEQKSGVAVRRNKGIVASSNVRYSGDDPEATDDVGYGDAGGASRFFYCAKASRAERNAGLDGFEEQVDVAAIRPRTRKCRVCGTSAKEPGPSGRYPNCEHGDWEYVENASARHKGGVRNAHPTVKPIDLMRWLVRLVTPPGGTVLDPFTGSGTTGIAAGLEGFDFVGIEREAEYREIAEARLKWWAEQEGETAEILHRAGLAEKERERAERVGQASLFETEAA